MNLDSIGVYRISSPNGSAYIGMTAKSFKERWDGHKANFRNGHMTCAGLRRAFEKYGVDAMSFEILEEMDGCSDAEILHREREWWLLHKTQGVNLYNGEPSGRGAVRHTEETRERISKSFEDDWRTRNGISPTVEVFRQQYRTSTGELRVRFVIALECESCGISFRGVIGRSFCSVSCSSRGNRNSNKVDAISKDHLISAVLEGGNSYAIAERLGIKKSSLYGLLQNYGLTIKALQMRV